MWCFLIICSSPDNSYKSTADSQLSLNIITSFQEAGDSRVFPRWQWSLSKIKKSASLNWVSKLSKYPIFRECGCGYLESPWIPLDLPQSCLILGFPSQPFNWVDLHQTWAYCWIPVDTVKNHAYHTSCDELRPFRLGDRTIHVFTFQGPQIHCSSANFHFITANTVTIPWNSGQNLV